MGNQSTYMLVGAKGYGKSCFGNVLLNEQAFSVYDGITDGTWQIQIEESKKYKLIDCPGFGYRGYSEEVKMDFGTRLLCDTMLARRHIFEKSPKIDGFIMVVQYVNDQSGMFLNSAKDFYNVMSVDALKSLLIVVIQIGSKRYGYDEFDSVLGDSPGYQYLYEKNSNKTIQYVLWDNFRPLPGQQERLKSALKTLTPFTFKPITFQLIESHRDWLKKENLTSSDDTPKT